METKKRSITGPDRKPIHNSKALIWGNNAAWLCECGELLGNRTGDTEYQVKCINCEAEYGIERKENRSGNLHLGAATGVRRTR